MQVSGSPNLVYINVSPIEYGHVLLVPRVLDDLPQLADPASMLLALRFCQAADNPYFRVAFNSLGAYATINHLHFQVCVWHAWPHLGAELAVLLVTLYAAQAISSCNICLQLMCQYT